MGSAIRLRIPGVLLAVALGVATAAAAAPASHVSARSATGIRLDAPWKVKLYALAHAQFHHPAWGWQHSERDYRLALRIAREDHLSVDKDALFAAAFLHDMAAFEPCADRKMEHGACAALQSPAILKRIGFPMQKIAIVQQAERGHMYYSDPGRNPTAIVLHDADSLDFLGDIGAARMIALTGAKAASFAPAVRTLRTFLTVIPPRLITPSARRIGRRRVAQLKAFLAALRRQTYDDRAQ